ncbi:MAG: tetratricopeptide repeat protein [Coriobacteriales bacterium]
MDIAVFTEAQEAYARGDYKTALVGFSACSHDVEELSDAEAGKFFHLIGNCYIKSGQPAKAAEYYGKAIELVAPERQPSLLVNLGTACLSSEDYPRALSAFARALDCPGYPTPYKALSGIGAVQLKLGAMEEAGAAYREAALDPANPAPGKALINLGICFMGLERPADAVSTLETALDLGLSASSANKCRACLGQAYLACGRVAEAVASFEAATADGSYRLSAVAAHDLVMARSLRDRFGAVLGGADERSQQPEPAAEEPVPEPEPAPAEPAELPASEEPEPQPEQPLEEEPADNDAMWEPSPLVQDETDAVQEQDPGEEPGEEQPADISEAVTETFPVISLPAEDEPELVQEAPEEAGELPEVPEQLQEDTLIPSPEDTAFFTITEEAIEQAAKEERRKARKGNRGLKVALGVVVVLILLAAAAAFAYVRGYGYPLQEQVAQRFLDAAIAQESTDAYWNESVTQESRESQMAVLEGIESYKVAAVERGLSNSTVYVEAVLEEGGTAYYEVMMGRDLISWDIEYVELYFPSEH